VRKCLDDTCIAASEAIDFFFEIPGNKKHPPGKSPLLLGLPGAVPAEKSEGPGDFPGHKNLPEEAWYNREGQISLKVLYDPSKNLMPRAGYAESSAHALVTAFVSTLRQISACALREL
jgi:hypothetical protein